MPKRKNVSDEEEDELINDNSDYAESSDDGKTSATARSKQTRKKSKPIKTEDQGDVDQPRAGKPKTRDTKPIETNKNASQSDSKIIIKTTPDGEKYIELGKKKRVTVRVFKGTPLIDIREFYADAEGTEKPGKKGLSLGLDQWETLKESSEAIDELLISLKNK